MTLIHLPNADTAVYVVSLVKMKVKVNIAQSIP